MARKRSLREYQAAVAERLKNLALQDASASSKLGFMISDMRWIINLYEVAEVLPVPAIVPIPLTNTYFNGMCNVRGNLYGIIDFAAFIGLPPLVQAIESRLLLLPPTVVQGGALLVSRMAGLRNPETLSPLEKQTDTSPWAKNLYRDPEGHIWHELDVAALAQQERFLNVGR